MASRPIYQFYAELLEFEPLIWRRFQVPDNITLARLGYIVMTLFEMRASHLFAVEWISGYGTKHEISKRYEVPGQDCGLGLEGTGNATAVKLSRITKAPGTRFNINYDYGDNWYVVIELEKVFEDKALPANLLPMVIEGAGYGIVEDCGGTYGLEELIEAFKKKRGERYKKLSQWLGVDSFDVKKFDIGDMNYRLKKIPRIYKQIYEDKLRPTEQSVALIEREYLDNGKGQGKG
jgi:hypothetical protein